LPTLRETILQALFSTLQTISSATIQRGEVLPERVPAGGLVVLSGMQTHIVGGQVGWVREIIEFNSRRRP